MKVNNDRLELAIIVSIILHLLLIGLLVLGSLFTNMIQPAAGGSGGDADTLDAVMVDTGQVAAEYGQIVAQKQSEKIAETEPKEQVVKDDLPKNAAEDVEKEKALVIAQQQKLEEQKRKQEEQQRQQEELKRQQEIAKQELLKKQEEETRKKAAEAARLKAEAEAKRLEAAAKQAEEERKVKEAEKQKQLEEQKRLAAEAKVKAEREAKAKAEQEAKAQAQREAKEKAEKEAKLKAEKEAKAKAEKEAKLKAEKEAKAKAKAAAEAKAAADAKAKADQQAKNNKALDDFLSGGDVGGGSSKGGNQNATGSQGNGNAKSVGDGFGTEDRGYENLIKKKLSRYYRVEENFRGRECRIKLFLERDGRISNYQVISGPEDICRAAVSAIVSAKTVPPAPSDQLYNKYKSPIMRFSLKIQ